MTVPVEVGVSYDSDLEEVERVTLEVAEEVMKEFQGIYLILSHFCATMF